MRLACAGLVAGWLFSATAMGAVSPDQIGVIGHHGIVILDASSGALSQTIPIKRDVVASSFDDRRPRVWVLDRERRLRAFDAQGNAVVDMFLPRHLEGVQMLEPPSEEHWYSNWFSGWPWSNQHDDDDLRLPDDLHDAELVVDKRDGSVWIAVDHGLLKYSVTGSLVQAYRVDDEIRQLSFDWAKGRLWIATHDDVFALDDAGKIPVQLDLGRDPDLETISFDDRLGALWVGRRDQIQSYNEDGSVAFTFKVRDPDSLAPDGKGNIWVLTHHGLRRYAQDGTVQFEPELGHHEMHDDSLVADVNDASLWVGDEHALYHIDAQGNVTEVPAPAGLPDSDDNDEDHGHGHDHDHSDHDHHGHDDSPQWRIESLIATGDVHVPTVTIAAPAAGTLVRPTPAIVLDYSDVGLGVNPSYTTLQVNGNPVAVDCSGDDKTATCTPKTPLTEDPLNLSLQVMDYAGNQSDAAAVQVLLDTDGDGHDDNHDTYPNDPSRWRLAAVAGVAPALQDKSVRISWTPEADTANTAGYYIYKKQAGQPDEVRLNDTPLNAVTYTDDNVTDGTGYSYRITAVDHKGNEGEPGTAVDFFVAYNYTPVTGVTAVRQKVAGAISWTAVKGYRYQVYRAEKGGDEVPLAQATAAAYLDTTTLWNKTYEYQVATIADFNNPFTSKTVSVIGPPSAQAELPALPPLAIGIIGGIPDVNGVPQFVITQANIGIAGNYQQAVGPITITATYGSKTVTTHAGGTTASGSFHLVLPTTNDSVWNIVASEDTVPDRTAAASVHLIKDTTPPQVAFDSSVPTTSADDNIVVSGTASDDLTGIAKLYLTSSRYSGQQFTLTQGANNTFSGDVPLEYGDNVFTAQAVDGAGNQASASLTIGRTAALAPTLVINSPQSGVTVASSHVDVSGVVYTGEPKDKVRISVNGLSQFPDTGDDIHGYPFTFSGVQLNEGYNTLQVAVDTPAGSTAKYIAVNYSTTPPAPPPQPAPPSVNITSPTDTTVNGDSTTITGNIGAGDTITINGQIVTADPDGNFQYTADLSACVSGTYTVTIVVTDKSGQSTTRTLVYTCDRDPPAIALDDAGLQAPPAVNRVVDEPYTLKGSVSDANLAGFTVNGQNVQLAPTGNDTYSFAAALNLPTGQAQTVTLQAWDAAGNTTSREVILNDTPAANIEIVSPIDGSQILSTDSGASINVVARITGLISGETVGVAPDGGAVQPMTLDSGVATTSLVTNLNSGDHKLAVEVLDTNKNVVASASTNITFVNQDTVQLTMDRSEPANGDTGVEPTAPINIYFNKPIDPTKLTVSLKETVHGMEYDLSNQQGVGFTQIPDPKLVQVDEDMQTKAGSIQVFPENRFVSFTPTQPLAYGGAEYVEVDYDGMTLTRFNFTVQPVPTIISGVVTDQDGIPLSGITVNMPDQDLTTTTDTGGNYSFGSGSTLHTAIPGGRHAIVVNTGMKDAQYGTLSYNADVQQGRFNNVHSLKLTRIDNTVPYVTISSGEAQAILADGGMQFDLSQAHLIFPGTGRETGNIHVDFLTAGEFAFPTTAGAVPQWLYGVQPAGIQVQGPITIKFSMPALYGSYSYIPPDGTLVVLLGFNPDTQTIETIGIGSVSHHTVTSVGSVDVSCLDYFGYAIVPPGAQQTLSDYRDGKITSLAALRSALDVLVGK